MNFVPEMGWRYCSRAYEMLATLPDHMRSGSHEVGARAAFSGSRVCSSIVDLTYRTAEPSGGGIHRARQNSIAAWWYIHPQYYGMDKR
jgi:hypothetical protein